MGSFWLLLLRGLLGLLSSGDQPALTSMAFICSSRQRQSTLTGQLRASTSVACRLFVEEPEPVPPVNRPVQPTASSSFTRPKPAEPTLFLPRPTASTHLQPKPAASTYGPPPVSAAPILLVLPAQPQAPSVLFRGPSCSQSFVPPAPTVKAFMPNKSLRPCGACHVPNCGGQRKRYTPSKDKVAGSTQKIFSYCPSTRKSTTSGFDKVVYDSFEHFKSVVDVELEKSV